MPNLEQDIYNKLFSKNIGELFNLINNRPVLPWTDEEAEILTQTFSIDIGYGYHSSLIIRSLYISIDGNWISISIDVPYCFGADDINYQFPIVDNKIHIFETYKEYENFMKVVKL